MMTRGEEADEEELEEEQSNWKQCHELDERPQ